MSTPHDHWVGKRVDVTWRTKEHGLTFFDCPPTKNKVVLRIHHVLGNEYLAVLEGQPCGPVRVERLSLSQP